MTNSDPSLPTTPRTRPATEATQAWAEGVPPEQRVGGTFDMDVNTSPCAEGGFEGVSTSVPGVMFVGRLDLGLGTRVQVLVPVLGPGRLVLVVRGAACPYVEAATLGGVGAAPAAVVTLRAARGSVPGLMATVGIGRAGNLVLTVEPRAGAHGVLEVWASGDALQGV